MSKIVFCVLVSFAKSWLHDMPADVPHVLTAKQLFDHLGKNHKKW